MPSDEVRRDLSASAQDFLRVVIPAIRPLIGRGRIEPVESTAPEGLRRDLDILAGIDAWQMVDEHGRMRGLASRIQWGDNWRSFTVRLERPNGSKTEKEKRISAFLQPQAGWLLPALTIQAYLTRPKPGGHLIEAGVIRTADLLDHMIRNPCPRARRDPEDGVMFEPYFWDDLAGLVRTVAGPFAAQPEPIRLPRRRDHVTVGHALYREVVNFAPDDLSPGELVVAWVIADDARDSTRVSWISNAELCRRSRMKPSGVRAALGRLAARGYEFRAIHGYRKDGRPVFAAKGHAADYLVPDMLKGAVSAAPLAAGGARKGAVVAHKGAVTAAPIGPKGAVVTAPLPSEDLNPLRQPSDHGPDLTPAVEGARASRQVNSSNVSEHERQHNALTRWEQSARGMTPIEAAAWNAIHPDGKQ